MEKAKENKMGTAPMLKLLISMSLPSMFSMLVQSLYNIVDSMFVAQVSEDALTAVSLAFPVQTVLMAVAVGTGVGVNSLISRRLGEKNQDAADTAATHGIVLALFSWVLFALFGIFFTRTFFSAFSDNPAIVEMGCQYGYIVTIFSFGVLVQIAIEKILQATGNMIYPMIFILVGAVTNIILDPILIFGYLGMPAMGVAGAAIATVAGQIFAMLLSLYVVFRKDHAVKISFKGFKFSFKMVKQIYSVGLPSIIMQSITSVLTAALNAILAGFSSTAVSVLGVYYKLQSFVFMPVFGLTHGVLPIVGYNYGARNKKRMTEAFKYGCIIGGCIMLVGNLIFLLFPELLLKIFSASDYMLEIGVPALQIISTCFIPAAVGIMFSTVFQAVGQGGKSLFLSALRQLVVILPVAYGLSKLGLGYVWYAFPIAEVVSLVAGIFLYTRLYRRHIKNLQPIEASIAG